jgi:O-antigen/teichoic acid export membrane protein
MSIISTLAKGTAWMLISAVVVKFSGWMYYVIIARLVTPEEIGMFYLAFSIISMIVIFSNLGLGSSTVVRYVPYYAGKRYFNHIREVVKISALFGTVFSTICFL